MVQIVDARKVIESFFLMLKEDIYVLIRIQSLVALVTAMFFVMFIVDFYRCRSRSSLLNKVFKTVDSLSDRIVVYVIGSMQAASFENQMFPVWAVVLVSLRASLGYLSGYGIPDHSRRLSELGNVIKFMGAGVLTGTRGLEFTKPLWSLWAILLTKSLYRFIAHEMALKSLLHGRNSEFLPEYMRNHARDRDSEHGGREPAANGNDEKYLVCGESKQNISLKRPSYTLQLANGDERSLITLDKILGSSEPLLRSSSSGNGMYKDIGVAFALSRLLRCRFEDVNLQRKSIDSTRNLITSKITDRQQAAAEAVTEPAAAAETAAVAEIVSAVAAAETEGERAFKILELELAFTRDYFHTLYPLVFWKGLFSLGISLLLSTATFGVAFWLAVDIRKVYHLVPLNKEENFMLQMHGGNVDVLITWLFMVFMMFKEVWEIVTYLLSNWTRLLLVCKYVQSRPWFRWLSGDGRLVRSFFKSNIADAWHGCMDQYDLLESCNYKPFFRKLASAISLGKIPQELDGRKRGETISVPRCVKSAILQALRRVNLKNPQLLKEIPSFEGSTQRSQRYSWACLELHTCSQVILVWHIATSLCEIELARECEIDLDKPGFLRSAWSGLKTFATCASKLPYLVNKNMTTAQLETDYHVAVSLSRYCAYLQVFLPSLLPDSFVVPDLIFTETLGDVRDQLKDCNLKKCSYSKLMDIAEEATGTNVHMSILQQGATLGKALIDNEDQESRWKILAEVWADLLVHIAPSWNVADHKHHLESGGEFITLIWALLSHCGIEKSSLWDKDEAGRPNPQVHHRENNGETSNNQPGPEQQVSETGIQPGPGQQEPEISAQVPPANTAETEQLDEDGIDEESLSEEKNE